MFEIELYEVSYDFIKVVFDYSWEEEKFDAINGNFQHINNCSKIFEMVSKTIWFKDNFKSEFEKDLAFFSISLHDYGRIAQFRSTKSFDDKNVDHHEIGASEIRKKFEFINPHDLDILSNVAKYHGLSIAESIDEDAIKYIKLATIIDDIENIFFGFPYRFGEKYLTGGLNGYVTSDKVDRSIIDKFLLFKKFDRKLCHTTAEMYMFWAAIFCEYLLIEDFRKEIVCSLLKDQPDIFERYIELAKYVEPLSRSIVGYTLNKLKPV